MNRKEFLKKTALGAVAVNSFSISDTFAESLISFFESERFNEGNTAAISVELNQRFLALVDWLTVTKWADFLKSELNVDLSLRNESLIKELLKEVDSEKLLELKGAKKGFDDFIGTALVKPGSPASSLLYHAIASPRVKPESVTDYPTIEQLDTLENYIFGLRKWEDYRIKESDELVMAVFAYEYRPAVKTPHQAHADMVYSRTGVARLGNKPLNYDKKNRLFTNKPKDNDDPSGKQIAVTAARYGLFICKIVDKSALSIISSVNHKGNFFNKDRFDDRNDNKNDFLLPVRKVFNEDLLFNSGKIEFKENHCSQKLSILLKKDELRRNSSFLIEQDTFITNTGSSFLVISKNKSSLINLLEDYKFQVKGNEGIRYFTSYSPKESGGEGFFVETISNNGQYRVPNKYTAGRNSPMYVHIAHRFNANNAIEQIPKTDVNISDATIMSFEDVINNQTYYAPIYEDGICDGAVSADISRLKNDNLNAVVNKGVFPAFSVVTAPDFFPFVDLADIKEFDVGPGTSDESNFFEGGVASLASARIRPNPQTTNPINGSVQAFPSQTNSDKLYNTLTAVISKSEGIAKKWDKDYLFSSFLPDSCSSVFAPGWDVTYANTEDNAYLSTQGLGSPFVEDMKLCAAMNGMWAVASPDTARVFQGTKTSDNNEWYANPTAIPLLDDELGFHNDSPASDSSKKINPFSWDGEQGAFLQQYKSKWMVNFTDLGRADYVQNCLDGKFDMSKLRELSSEELVNRMSALKKCIHRLNHKTSVAKNNLWLVSAEKYINGKFVGDGIPANLYGTTKNWATSLQFSIAASENCYLYVFADTIVDGSLERRKWAEGQDKNQVKRRLLPCKTLYVCQVSKSALKYCEVISNGSTVSSINWRD